MSGGMQQLNLVSNQTKSDRDVYAVVWYLDPVSLLICTEWMKWIFNGEVMSVCQRISSLNYLCNFKLIWYWKFILKVVKEYAITSVLN